MKKLKILLAEDDPNISTIARLALEKLGGHQVTWVQDGEAAVAKAKNENFDLIILDEMMPKLNGVAACRRISQELAQHPPIIFLSAKSQDSDIREFQKIALGYIAKPFDPMTLSAEIDRVLQDKKRESA